MKSASLDYPLVGPASANIFASFAANNRNYLGTSMIGALDSIRLV